MPPRFPWLVDIASTRQPISDSSDQQNTGKYEVNCPGQPATCTCNCRTTRKRHKAIRTADRFEAVAPHQGLVFMLYWAIGTEQGWPKYFDPPRGRTASAIEVPLW